MIAGRMQPFTALNEGETKNTEHRVSDVRLNSVYN